MAPPRGKFLVDSHRSGAMKEKDFHPLIFRYYSLSADGSTRLRRVTGKAVVRYKTKRKNEWEKRNGRA